MNYNQHLSLIKMPYYDLISSLSKIILKSLIGSSSDKSFSELYILANLGSNKSHEIARTL
jgi:hypothetical protein